MRGKKVEPILFSIVLLYRDMARGLERPLDPPQIRDGPKRSVIVLTKVDHESLERGPKGPAYFTHAIMSCLRL